MTHKHIWTETSLDIACGWYCIAPWLVLKTKENEKKKVKGTSHYKFHIDVSGHRALNQCCREYRHGEDGKESLVNETIPW